MSIGIAARHTLYDPHNPYQTTDCALTRHYDAEWNVKMFEHDWSDKWVNLVVHNAEREDIVNFNTNSAPPILKMRDDYLERVTSTNSHYNGFELYATGSTPSIFTVVFTVSDNTSGYICDSTSHYPCFGKSASTVLDLRPMEYTNRIMINNNSLLNVSSILFFMDYTQCGLFNPITRQYLTATRPTSAFANNWGIGNFYNQARNSQVGAKFYSIRVYNRVLTIDELLYFDNIDRNRFGSQCSLGYNVPNFNSPPPHFLIMIEVFV